MKTEKRFLPISVYRFPLGDCTASGLSSKVGTTILLEHPEGFLDESSLKDPQYGGDYLVVEKGPFDTLRLVPSKLKAEKKWYMNGGNFGYTSDSRFSKISKQPIAIFDRVESK
jgi:hypothetical protein